MALFPVTEEEDLIITLKQHVSEECSNLLPPKGVSSFLLLHPWVPFSSIEPPQCMGTAEENSFRVFADSGILFIVVYAYVRNQIGLESELVSTLWHVISCNEFCLLTAFLKCRGGTSTFKL